VAPVVAKFGVDATIFETAPFDRSGIPPRAGLI
jgi:hypothetical protein